MSFWNHNKIDDKNVEEEEEEEADIDETKGEDIKKDIVNDNNEGNNDDELPTLICYGVEMMLMVVMAMMSQYGVV